MTTMRPRIIPREHVARHLAVSTAALARYEARGLIRCVREGDVEGYEPSEVRRVWTVLSLHRDAGVNLAGIEAILRLRDHLDDVHGQLRRLASELRLALEADLEAETDETDFEG
jgi:MerR family transcriptional regulator/heat shock protein HspR